MGEAKAVAFHFQFSIFNFQFRETGGRPWTAAAKKSIELAQDVEKLCVLGRL